MIKEKKQGKDSKSKIQISRGGVSIFRNGGLPRLPELVKHDDSDTIKEVISACIGIMC